MRYLGIISLAFAILTNSCRQPPESPAGKWTGVISMEEKMLPLEFSIIESNHDFEILFLNGDEKFESAEIAIIDDSVYIDMKIFDVKIVAKMVNGQMSGYYDKSYNEDYKLPFKAEKSISRFEKQHTDNKINGRYKVLFDDADGNYPAVGIFTSNSKGISGTFLTETGDYRYLEGVETADSIFLSSYDGEHLFLFEASKQADSLVGGFWSGIHYYADWKAVPTKEANNAILKDADSLTFLKSGYEKLSFSFPNITGDSISLNDYQGKPVIIQILGSWCPNCMDETKFLAEWYRDRTKENIEIIGLAYERKTDFDYAASRVRVFKEKLKVDYPILIAGSSDKEKASASLPMLNKIISFPTTIFLNKNHEIIRIYTGFNGPGTGDSYKKTVADFYETVKKISSE